MSDTMNMKDAFFALDTDIDEDMADYKTEVTTAAIKYINGDASVYKYVKGNLEYGLSVKDSATTWANDHNHEFGDLFITELDLVDWKKVASML